VFPVGRGCHVVNGCHLVTPWFDTALIDDVGRGGVVGEVVLPPCALAGPAGMSWTSSFGGGLTPCRAHLPGKGGPSPDGDLLLWLDLGPSDLHVSPLSPSVPCILTWVGASISSPCLCIVWATDPGFVAPTTGARHLLQKRKPSEGKIARRRKNQDPPPFPSSPARQRRPFS
jgi:hypothetical protein